MNTKGEVPNFGPSDSAVIFPFADDVLNYKTTINLSKFLLNGTALYNSLKDKEEIFWFYDISKINIKETSKKLTCFEKSGYWYQNFGDWNVFFRAGKAWHRPFHDDMFHIDLWYKGINFLCDMGTYSYNHSLENPEYYISSSAHNTVNVFPSNEFINLSKFMIVNWKEGLVYDYKSTSIKGKRTIGINCEHFRNINSSKIVFP